MKPTPARSPLRWHAALLGLLCIWSIAHTSDQARGEEPTAPGGVPYGENVRVGGYADLNGAKLYYEIYGKGEPLVLLHGNGGSIGGMSHQIELFAAGFKVIAMDCRGRGKSELGAEPLTYELMAKDAIALLRHLQVPSAHVVGRSDGGIVALLMAIHFPERVKKIVAFGANISPDTDALYFLNSARRDFDKAVSMINSGNTNRNWILERELNSLLVQQPHISVNDLKLIKSHVLVMSCDRDVIKEEHTLLIYRSIPRASLCILPNETHWITSENPALCNAVVSKFLSDAFRGEEAREL